MQLPDSLLSMLSAQPQEETPQAETQEVPRKKLPLLRVEKDKRKGNVVTLITGYGEESEEVRALCKQLKQQLAVGGSTRDGDILLQGDVCEKANSFLQQQGYRTKKIGF